MPLGTEKAEARGPFCTFQDLGHLPGREAHLRCFVPAWEWCVCARTCVGGGGVPGNEAPRTRQS